jgi:hypothetical protein
MRGRHRSDAQRRLVGRGPVHYNDGDRIGAPMLEP